MVKIRRLQKSEIEKMIELKKMGYTQKDIGKRFNISRTTVRYHLDKNFKKTIIKSSAERKKLPEEKEKARKRMNEKYHKDKDFRKKQIERSKEYIKKNPEKKREMQHNYWEKNKDKISEQRIKKRQIETRNSKILFGALLLAILTVLSMTLIMVLYVLWVLITGG